MKKLIKEIQIISRAYYVRDKIQIFNNITDSVQAIFSGEKIIIKDYFSHQFKYLAEDNIVLSEYNISKIIFTSKYNDKTIKIFKLYSL